MVRDAKDDPTEELGCQLSPAERVVRVMQEVDGVYAMYGITDWEKNFLQSNSDSKWPKFTEKQEARMQIIEAKVFNEKMRAAREAEDRVPEDEDFFQHRAELDGQLRFKKK